MTTPTDRPADDRQSCEVLKAMIEEELVRQDAEQDEDEADPFAGIVDVKTNDGWDA